MTAWDLWQYCLNQLHGTAGTCALQKHAALDARISIDFQLGPTGMLPNCHHHITSLTFEAVQQYSLEDKQLWLDSMRLGCKEYANALGTPPLAESP